MTILAYSPWGNGNSVYPFDKLFDEAVDAREHGLSTADAFLLWGGTDIHPSFYNEQPHKFSGAPTLPSERDMWEWKAMKYCKAHNIPIIGVCRGAQFMCAFAGGGLIQHVTGHTGGSHPVVTASGELFSVTSSHHQMLDVHGTNHELIAWTPKRLSSVYYQENNHSSAHIGKAVLNNEFKEPEIVFFPDIKGLAIQGHPEWAEETSEFVTVTLNLVQEYLFAEEWN
jgi:anthranilate/para-aminobenzoate synthase component II